MRIEASALCIALVAVASCSCDGDDVPPRDATMDASRDGGVIDAGVRDGGPRDGGPRDGGADAGPSDPGWTALPGLPAGCNIEVAAHPERLGPLGWQACFDGRVGCQELVVGWGDWSVRETLSVYDLFASWDGAVLGVLRKLDALSTLQFLVVAPDGEVVRAYQYTLAVGECLVGPAAGTREHAAFAVNLPSRMRPPQMLIDLLPEARLIAVEDPALAAGFVQRLSLSRTGMLGAEVVPGPRVATIRDGVFRMVATGASNHPVAVGDTLLFDDFQGVYDTVSKEDPDGAVSPYIAPSDTDVKFLSSDGEWLAWVEGRTRLTSPTHWAATTVMVARFEPDPTALAPRSLLELGESYGSYTGVGGGWVVIDRVDSGRYTKVAVSIETGAQRLIVPPAGFYFPDKPLYVTVDEVALPLVEEVSGIHRTIWRVSLRD